MKSLQIIPCIHRIFRVGQNHIYTVYVRYVWQENHHMYGCIRCICTVLATQCTSIILAIPVHLLFRILEAPSLL